MGGGRGGVWKTNDIVVRYHGGSLVVRGGRKTSAIERLEK